MSSRHFAKALLLMLLLTLIPTRSANAATFTVTTIADSGAGSLRQALIDANAQAGPHTIQFAITGCPNGICIITPLSALPALSGDPTTIDATTQTGWTTTNRTVVLDGTSAGLSHGLTITSAGHTVKGLVITNFQGKITDSLAGGSGIFISGSGATNNRIIGNYLGVASDGVSAAGNAFYGVWLYDGASNNQIGGTAAGEGNLLAGNAQAEVFLGNILTSATVSNNTVVGNLIGTDATGETVLSFSRTQSHGGVVITSYTDSNVIGPQNTIGGYTGTTAIAGITLFSNIIPASSALPTATRIIGNYIGVNANGTALANETGIGFPSAGYGALNTVIGGTTSAERNYIAGNNGAGIELHASSYPVENLTISGNWIGFKPNTTGMNESDLLPNGYEGILLGRSDTAPIIPVTIRNNVISANRLSGIDLRSDNNIVQGNFIGTSVDGMLATPSKIGTPPVVGFANLGAGIVVNNGSNNTIGGSGAGEGNVLAYGGSSGQYSALWLEPLYGLVSANNLVEGNYIGVRADGAAPLYTAITESSIGVQIDGSADNRIVNNVIGGNGYGIYLQSGSGTPTNTTIDGNAIGTDATRNPTNAVANLRNGIYLTDGTDTQIINNLIANNGTASSGATTYHGIKVDNNTVQRTLIRANRLVNNGIGFGFGGSGVYVSGATGVTISRSETTGNKQFGIELANGGNASLAAPSITATNLGGDLVPRITGTACAGCTVEIFTSDVQEDDEGPIFVSSGSADGTGAFAIPIAGCSTFLTATATDSAGNTSQFTSPMVAASAGVCSPPNFAFSTAIPAATQNSIPGGQAVYTHTLTNLDTVTHTFTLARSSSQGWALAPVPAMLDLPGNASATVVLTVNVPLSAVVGAQDITAVTATSGTTVQSQADTTVVASPGAAQPAISPGVIRIVPAGATQVTFTHQVSNTGGVSGTFRLDVTPATPLPTGWGIVSASLATATLMPGEITQATLVMSLPVNAPPNQAVFQLQVTETSNGSAAQTSDTLIVSPMVGFAFSESRESPIAAVAPGQVITFTHHLTNTGNATDTFSITTQLPSSPGVWSLAQPITPNPIVLGGGEVATVTLRVQVPFGIIGGPFALEVGAQSLSPASPAPITRTNIISEVIAGALPLLSLAPPQLVHVVGVSRTITFTHVLTNVGNGPATFVITPTLPISATGWVTPTLVNSTCATQPITGNGGTCGFAIEVNVPADSAGGSYPLTVQATAQDRTNAITTTYDLVIVETVADLRFTPDYTASGDPGTVLTYTHTLTNTGNATDSYTLTDQLSGPLGWQAIVSPTQLIAVPRGMSRTVQLVVTVPTGVEAIPANNSIITVTVHSTNVPTVTAQVVDITAIRLSFGVRISDAPPQNAQPTATLSATLTFTHFVTNTGSATLSYTLAVSNSQVAWPAPVVSPTLIIALAPSRAMVVRVTVVVPAGALQGITNTTSVRVYNITDTLQLMPLTSTNDSATVGVPFDMLLTPSFHSDTVQPGATRSYTHTLTNRGLQNDIFILTTISGLGWTILVAPDQVELGAGESVEVVVAIYAPTSALSDTIDTTELRVQSVALPSLNARAQEKTTVIQAASLSLTPRQFRTLDGTAQTIQLIHTLVNTGNGLETYVITASNDLGWDVSIVSSATPTLGVGVAYPVQVRISVPAGLEPGTFNTLRVNATPQSNPSARQSVTTTLNYPKTAPAFVPKQIYLPIIER